jgi:hypothetical protein
MSVLTASIGRYSILRGNTAPATAIAAGAETLGYALLEAHGQLQSDPARPVLVIYADETVPEIWAAAEHAPHAIALLLHNAAETRLYCARSSSPAKAADPQTQSHALAECLRNGTPSAWQGERSMWQWRSTTA